jgi:hypothetical protein
MFDHLPPKRKEYAEMFCLTVIQVTSFAADPNLVKEKASEKAAGRI